MSYIPIRDYFKKVDNIFIYFDKSHKFRVSSQITAIVLKVAYAIKLT